MPLGRPLGAKLFIEGKEVPFIGATMAHTVGQASIAYIDLVPHGTINNIKPRTHVQISVRDYNDPKNDFPYVHAWDGEVFGYNFSKTPGNRSFSLSCIDLSSYWDNVLSYFINPVSSLGKGANNITGIGLDVDTAEKSGIKVIATSDSLSSLLYQTIQNETKDKDFVSGFVKLYDQIAKVNAFYNIAESRLRIYDRVVIKSSSRLKQLLDEQQALQWFQGMVGQMGGFTTLRSVVQDLMSVIFHDFTSIPFAARVERSDIKGKSVYADGQTTKFTVGQFAFKPNLFMIPPPLCNVFFPDEYSNFQYSRNFFKEPTRLIYKPELPTFLNSGGIALGYQFEPPSYHNFMLGKKPSTDYGGADDLAAAEGGPQHFQDVDTDPNSSQTNNNRIREGQFLTNEEKMKGVWMAIESMMPAATTFRQEVGGSGQDPLKFIAQISKYLFYKKRFENRSLQITCHLKLSIVPGFNILLLDDSDAGQSTLAYCSSVTHRIFATEGGYTNVQLSYARTVDEEKNASSNGAEPAIPPWFDEAIFGNVGTPPPSPGSKAEVNGRGPAYSSPADGKLSEYYMALLGNKGYKALTDYYPEERTIYGATQKLIEDYRTKKPQGSDVLQEFIAGVTGRDYIRVRDFFDFLGAKLPNAKQATASANPNAKVPEVPLSTDIRNSNFNVFAGGAFDTTNKDFGAILKVKNKVIDAYQTALKELRGFRG
jgi:hypothetical protein